MFGRSWYRYAESLMPDTKGPWVDLGCGAGEFLQLGARRGMRGFGLDIEPTSIETALSLGSAGVVANLERGMPFRDASLEGLSMIELIEHVFEAEALLRESARVLRPGGWLVMTTPNVASIQYRVRALTGHPPKQEGYHRRFFTRRLLNDIVEQAGFVVDQRASYGTNSLISKWKRLRLGQPRYKHRYAVPALLEPLLAGHFVWRLRRVGEGQR